MNTIRFKGRSCLRLLCLLCSMYVTFTYISRYLVQRNILEFYNKPYKCTMVKKRVKEKKRPIINSKENISRNGRLQSMQKLDYVRRPLTQPYICYLPMPWRGWKDKRILSLALSVGKKKYITIVTLNVDFVCKKANK